MKYIPKIIDLKTKKRWGEYCNLTSYRPSCKPSGGRFVCNVCKKTFITDRGATNHVDYKHPEKVKAIQAG